MKHSILCVDDEKDILAAIQRIFRKKYNILVAHTGELGLELLKQNNVSLIISDQKMPEMTGVEFLKKSVDINPKPIRILLTGYTDIDSVINAINNGEIYKYVTKPWDPVDFSNTVDKAIEKFELREQLVEKNKALQLAYEELKTLDQAKTNFMFLVNHELKTPLTVMSSFVELLKESELDKEQSIYTSRIEKSVKKLNLLIHDVLELISAETGQIELHFQKISSKNLFEDLDVKYLKPAKYKEVEIHQEIEDLKLLIDKKIILNILDRIIDNALKFCEKKSTIKIQVKEKSDTPHRAVITISNQGPPLSESIIQKILQPFTLNEDTMNHTKGFGLGLSICQSYLGTQNSGLQFKSKEGVTQVLFELDIAL